jgi:hypothetical protein
MAWYEIGFQRDLTPLYFKMQSANPRLAAADESEACHIKRQKVG